MKKRNRLASYLIFVGWWLGPDCSNTSEKSGSSVQHRCKRSSHRKHRSDVGRF